MYAYRVWILIFMAYSNILSLNAAQNMKTYLDTLYQNINGYGISVGEEQLIQSHGGNSTYGEITYEAVKQLLKDTEIAISAKDVFYDLGSGIGKMTIQVGLEAPVKKSIGVELSESRYNHAQKVLQKIDNKNAYKIQFINKSIIDSTLNLCDATVIYLASTCFSDSFMKKIADKLMCAANGLRIITLKRFPEHTAFIFIKELELPMTWSAKVPVYIYRLNK